MAKKVTKKKTTAKKSKGFTRRTITKADAEGKHLVIVESPTKAKVVEIFRKYNADMQKAGRPYRYG